MKIIVRSYFSLLFCLLLSTAYAQPAFVAGTQKVDMSLLKKTHPRVMVSDFEPIKASLKTDSVMQNWLSQLAIETNMDALALRFRLTGDTAVLRQAYDSAMSVNMEAKIKTGPHHYGRFITYMGCTYDWLHDYMSIEQRDQLLKVIKRGLEAYLVDPDKTNFHNMNHCLNAGAIVAAIAVADEEPALAKKVLEVAINTINLTWYKPDGVTPEGPHYMNWSSLIMISGLSTLDIAFNKSFGLSDEPGLMGYGDFMMNITVPKRGIGVKYSDCYTNGTFYNLGQFFWIANKFNRPDIAQYAIENDQYTAYKQTPDYSGKMHQLLWYNSKLLKADSTVKHQNWPLDKQFKSAELAVMRNSWDDDNTIFAGLKGTDNYRQANFYHRHTNTGTFFLSALGQEWAVDLGLEDYGITDYNVKPRLYYKLRAEGHNCNIINPASGIDQMGWENCPLIAQGHSLQSSFSVVDMTPDYVKLAKSAKRGLMLFDNRRKVLLQDEFTTLDGKPLDSYWFMQTEAGIEIAPDGRSAILYRANEKMLVYMATAPKDARFTVMGTEPLIYTKPVKHRPGWTFGAKKLTIHTNTESDLKLAIVFVPMYKGEKAIPEKLVYKNLADWKVAPTKEATLSAITINKKMVPNFDKRLFTYTVDEPTNEVSKIAATSSIKNATITIKSDKSVVGKTVITVAAPNYTTSVYIVYGGKKSVKIVGNNLREYSSWDESFANHCIHAEKIKSGENIDYTLNDLNTVSAMTIGLTNTAKKEYKIELWASVDKINWTLAYKGTSKKVPYTKNSMPQLFSFAPFAAKYIRIKNAGDDTFASEVLCFHETQEEANAYLNNAYKEVLSDVVFTPKNVELKSGAQLKLQLDGLSNYGNKISLSDATITYESEDANVFKVSNSGQISANAIGNSFLRVVVQKGDFVFHKKIEIKVMP